MNIAEMTPEQSRASRKTLGLSQRFIATETGINRSQLALFEVGKYNLEAFKRLALMDCYMRLGYRFDTELPSASAVIPSFHKNEVDHPITTRKSKDGSANKAAHLPRIIDGILIPSGITNSDIENITTEIKSNDLLIKRLAVVPVRLSWLSGEPFTNEHETIIRIMARNYQLIRNLQGRAIFPDEGEIIAKNSSPASKTAAALADAMLMLGIEQAENR